MIASAGEPWILLPLVFAGRKDGIASEYGHASAYRSHVEMVKQLPGGHADYLKACSGMAREIYSRLSAGDITYFLDKTPRYYLIIPELLEMFPDAYFIFLHRNPVSVFASLLEFHGRKARHIYFSKDDLVKGSGLLDQGLGLASDRGVSVRYEDLVEDPNRELRKLMGFLDLEFEDQQISGFEKIHFGRGDPIGTKQYSTVVNQPREKWKKTMNTRFLRLVCRKWIMEIGSEVLTRQGYNLNELMEGLAKDPPSWNLQSLADRLDFLLGAIYAKLQLNLLFKKKHNGVYLR